MNVTARCLSGMSDQQLEASLQRLVRQERGVTAELVAHLAEVDRRHLAGGRAEATLFNYCVRVLGFTEDEACRRIRVARVARRYPVVYELLAEGEVGLTAVSRLAPYLTDENHRALLEAAKGRTIKQLEEVLAEWFPQPDAPTLIRKLPASKPAVKGAGAVIGAVEAMAPSQSAGEVTSAAATGAAPGGSSDGHADSADPGAAPGPGRSAEASASPTTLAFVPVRRGDRGSVRPLSPDRYRVQFTVSESTRDKILRAQALMRHAQPDGDLAVIIDRAVSLLIDHVERRKLGRLKRRDTGETVEGPAEESAAAGALEGGAGAATRPPRPTRERRTTGVERVLSAAGDAQASLPLGGALLATGKISDERIAPEPPSGGTPATEVVSRRMTGGTPATEVVSRRMTGGTPATEVVSRRMTGGTPATEVVSRRMTGRASSASRRAPRTASPPARSRPV